MFQREFKFFFVIHVYISNVIMPLCIDVVFKDRVMELQLE